MKLTNSLMDQMMALAAFRYCLGRRSYIVGICVDWIRLMWSSFSKDTQFIILRDIIEAYLDGCTGMDMDTIDWLKVLQDKIKTLNLDSLEALRRSVQWKLDNSRSEEKKEFITGLLFPKQ